MSRLRALTAVFLWTLVASVPSAGAGTCTITGVALFSFVPSAGPFVFRADGGGYAIPVDVDAAKGTITVHRGSIPNIDVGTQGGAVVLQMAGADVVGSIDSSGQIWLPGFNLNFRFAGTLDLTSNPSLSTDLQSETLNSVDYPSRGVPLDFATGIVTLVGGDIIPNAPIVEEPVVSGVRLTCRLDPIPDPSTLPPPPALKGLKAKARVVEGEGGDSISIRGALVGRPAAVVKPQDLFIRIATLAGQDIVLLRAAVTEHGRQLIVLAGGQTPTNARVAVRGKRRKATFTVNVSGLELGALAPGQVLATVSAGPLVGSKTATVRAGAALTIR